MGDEAHAMMGFQSPLRDRPYKPWHGYLLAVVVCISLVMAGVNKVKTWFATSTVPTAEVPEVTYDDVVNEGTPAQDPEPTPVVTPPQEEPTQEPEPVIETRTQYNLALPWLSQAPFGVWDAMHEETCEEASMAMVIRYYEGEMGDIAPAEADAELFNIVAYEVDRGYDVSITAFEAASVIQGYYPGYLAEVVEDPSVNDLKAYIDAGKPIIVPAAGRELGNPFFSGEGPLYHMLVLRGYTEDSFITNDPGTRHGKNYSYDIDVFMEAIGDWEGHNPASGAKRVIVITPVQ